VSEERQRALAEVAYCEAILAKSGLTILNEVFADAAAIGAWEHHPPGDVFDPASTSQWYYHCHPATAGDREHGHFHCFIRPAGASGPVHHLVAVGVDAGGRPIRLFTVNQWVVGDAWIDAPTAIALLSRFDVQMPRPSYLLNRWLSGIVRAYEPQIGQLLLDRDRALAESAGGRPAAVVREDRSLEVLSELPIGTGASGGRPGAGN